MYSRDCSLLASPTQQGVMSFKILWRHYGTYAFVTFRLFSWQIKHNLSGKWPSSHECYALINAIPIPMHIWLGRDLFGIRANSMTVMYSTKDIQSSRILFMHVHILCMNSNGGIHLPPTCKINYVNIQHDYLNMWPFYVLWNTTWLCWNAQKTTTYL